MDVEEKALANAAVLGAAMTTQERERVVTIFSKALDASFIVAGLAVVPPPSIKSSGVGLSATYTLARNRWVPWYSDALMVRSETMLVEPIAYRNLSDAKLDCHLPLSEIFFDERLKYLLSHIALVYHQPALLAEL